MVGVALNHESNGKAFFRSWNRIIMQDLNVKNWTILETLVSYASSD
jgi:outer membrane phospholipase A